MPMDVAIPMSRLLSEQQQSSIASAIWGLACQPGECVEERETSLKWFTAHCVEEKGFVMRRNPKLLDELPLPDIIRTLKRHPDLEKRRLVLQDEVDQEMASSPCPSTTALELAVRIMFLTACKDASQETIGGRLFYPRWNDSESLAEYIARVYPRTSSQPALQDVRPIRVEKLAVGYLKRYAKLNLVWTHRLSDHLTLLKRSNRKTLYIFRHPAFLKVSLDTLDAHGLALHVSSISDALSLGCLPPELLRETLATFNLLFPEPGDNLSQTILQNEVSSNHLDQSLLLPFWSHYGDHVHPQDALDPEDVRGLYQKYPYWAERVYALWRESDDPMPTTWIERWSESRKNPRFTYWCTVVAIAIAVSFGFVAAVLSAIQTWISYCAWIDDPTKAFCGRNKANDTSAPGE